MNANVDESKGNNEYFKYFVKKPLRRSPCINRGYWLRIHAVKSKIDDIAAATRGEICVVNLGCGFDPLPFQLLDPSNKQNAQYENRLSFVDLDYPDLLKEKKTIVNSNHELENIVGELRASTRVNGAFEGNNYCLAPCDLNIVKNFDELAANLSLNDPNQIKIFVAEVSLAYMKSEKANAVITACSKLPNSHFIILEQLLPSGPFEPFSRQMLKHFKKNDSPLQTVVDHQTKPEQELRFQSCRFPLTNFGNMYQLWESVSNEMKRKIDAIESFDELEEFFMFCHHYLIGHATNVTDFQFKAKFNHTNQPAAQTLPKESLGVEILPFESENVLQRKFGASTILPTGEIIYANGCFNNRLNDILLLDPKTRKIRTLDISTSSTVPLERMCHTLTSLSADLCVLVAGRAGPNNPYSDIWILHKTRDNEWKWTQGPSLPETRYRHSACALNSTQVLIFGGCTNGETFLIYDHAKNAVLSPRIEGTIKSCSSSAFDFNKNTQQGVIVGGLSKDGVVLDEMQTFSYDSCDMLIKASVSHCSPLLKKYGSRAVFTSDNQVMVVGGYGPDTLFDQDSTIIQIDTDSGDITLKIIPTTVWEKGFPIMAGFELLKSRDGVVYILGGGAVCYGFGSVWNTHLTILN